MSDLKFTHLHVHSEYSLLDGSAKISELIARAKEHGMDSVAITDHGVMYGVVDFYKEAKENGIKPIIGCEIYVATGSRFEKSGKDNNYYHLILLCENNTGYQNLIKLVSAGFTEGFYYKPRVDIELLRQHKDGLIALSACIAGPVAKNLLNGGYDIALKEALMYDEIFGRGNFYLEIQDHGLSDQQTVNQGLIRMNSETGIPLVCTNDSHYIYSDDAKAHEILLCIQTAKTINDEDRMVYGSDQFYFKSAEEMHNLFPYAKEALENTNIIAARCNVEIRFNEYKLPRFDVPDGKTAFEYLQELCMDGLRRRYGEATPELTEKLLYELTTIDTMGFSHYFLIVWDFIKYAKDNGIMVGPGRGSAAGSIASYCLNITNIDPIKYSLIFERFLNPERISMPDIDIDFCYERRQEVIDYVIKKYGADHVAQIITFGTMAAKAVIRDVGRALAMPYSDVDRIAKMVPFELGITIKRALELNPELSKAYAEEDDTRYLIDMATRLEGLPRHASTHAAGVVICDKPVTEYVPLNLNDGVFTTQFPMTTLEELGLLKMDFLGLRTLTVIRDSVKEINRSHKSHIDMERIDYDDKKVYELISSAKTEGVFQLESSGMKSFMRELQPSCIDDIIAGISLYRPGPMDFIPKYVKGKRNAATVTYTHEKLRPILKSTYGCIVYQEQVLQIVRDLAGYSMGRSDLVRRAMSKKKASVMQEERQYFVHGIPGVLPGCVNNGIPEDVATQIFDEMVDFSRYAFVKSHAAAYAVVGYQTAWLKVYYPLEFMAATMTSVIDSTSKIVEYINECKKLGIKILPPDINESFAHFSVSGNAIRFGFLAIKNVGYATIAALVREREENGRFTSITNVINRLNGLDGKDINKRCIEAFIKSGAFDSLGGKRAQYMDAYPRIQNGITSVRKKNIEGQMNLFDFFDDDDYVSEDDNLRQIEEYPRKQLLSYEKEAIGIYISDHPLSDYEDILKTHTNATSLDFVTPEGDEARLEDGKRVTIGGIITDKKIKYQKTDNRPMAFLTVEDLYGTVEVIVFAQVYEKYMGRLNNDEFVVVAGYTSVREDEDAKIKCNEIKFLSDMTGDGKTGASKTVAGMTAATPRKLWIKIPAGSPVESKAVVALLKSHRGHMPVVVYKEAENKKISLEEKYWVEADDNLLLGLEEMLGRETVKIV